MRVDVGWGADTNARGLAAAYHGDYFPLSYQTFQLPAALGDHSSVSATVWLKIIMLIFDIGCFAALVALLRRWNASPRLALAYWLQPYFMVLSWLGYVDFEMGFFMLLAIVILAYGSSSWVAALTAGLPLAVDVMLKSSSLQPVARSCGRARRPPRSGAFSYWLPPRSRSPRTPPTSTERDTRSPISHTPIAWPRSSAAR
jgi:hypothetical protein